MSKQIIPEEFKRMRKLVGLITESQLEEAIGDFNPSGFIAAIKETLKKMGYEVKDLQKGGDPYSPLEKDANEGKKSAAVGTLKWAEGEEVIAAISISMKDSTADQLKAIKDLEDKVYDVYAKDFTTRLNKINNGRVAVVGIKNKQTQPQQESLDIDAVVNEALAKARKK